MRMEKHILAEPSTKQISVVGIDRFKLNFTSQDFILSSSIPHLYLYIGIYHPSSHLLLYDNNSEREYYPINLTQNTSGLCRQVYVCNGNTHGKCMFSWRSTRCSKYVWSYNTATHHSSVFYPQQDKQIQITKQRQRLTDARVPWQQHKVFYLD